MVATAISTNSKAASHKNLLKFLCDSDRRQACLFLTFKTDRRVDIWILDRSFLFIKNYAQAGA